MMGYNSDIGNQYIFSISILWIAIYGPKQIIKIVKITLQIESTECNETRGFKNIIISSLQPLKSYIYYIQQIYLAMKRSFFAYNISPPSDNNPEHEKISRNYIIKESKGRQNSRNSPSHHKNINFYRKSNEWRAFVDEHRGVIPFNISEDKLRKIIEDQLQRNRDSNLLKQQEKYFDMSVTQSPFMKTYTEKLKKQRKRLAKRNKRNQQDDYGSYDRDYGIKNDQQQQIALIVKKTNNNVRGSLSLRKQAKPLSTFNWPTKKTNNLNFLIKKRAHSPQIHNNIPKFTIRSQTPTLTPKTVDNLKQQLKSEEIPFYTGSALYSYEKRLQQKSHKTKNGNLKKSEKLELNPWNSQNSRQYYINNLGKSQDFGIEDYEKSH